MYAHLPKNEKSFSVDIVGEDTNVKYDGTFTVRCVLSISGKHALELEKTRLMADYANPSNGLRGISITLATLRARIVEAPKWWTQLDSASDLLDENVLLDIYDRCILAETEWRKKVKEIADSANKAEEETVSPKGN